MVAPAIVWGVGQGALWGYRAYRTYRAVRAAQAVAATAEAALEADRERRAAELARAAAAARALSQSRAREEPCDDCDSNPCAHLAAGAPGSRYRGGAHGLMQAPGVHSHHMPARSISPLHPDVGPAIQMEPQDHRRTFSYGRSPRTAPQLSAQKALIDSGQFMAAQAQDIAEIESKFPGKYDEAIAQVEAYTACLKKNGIIR